MHYHFTKMAGAMIELIRELRELRRQMKDVGVSWSELITAAREYIEEQRVIRQSRRHRDARALGANADDY